MTNINFFGGVDEIGGNKIRVEGKNESFFFDFGMAFSKANDYLSEFLQPRKANGILDFVELGLLPCIKGIYREDYLRHVGLSYPKEPSVDGVLISHSHVDHVAYVHHLREDIPIYLSNESYLILKALEDTGTSSFSEYLHLKKTFYMSPKVRGDGYKRTSTKIKRDIRIVEPYKKFNIGNFQIKSAPVDHSLPGASAFIVEGEEETIVYTGDLRFHGRNPELTRKFVREAAKANPTIMISEGTRIDKKENISEDEIEQRASSEIAKHKGLVVVNYPVRDLDRLLTFYKVAQDTERKLVISLKQAYLLKLFQGTDNVYPDLSDVIIYKPRKGWGLIGDDNFACVEDEWLCADKMGAKESLRDYKKWEREFLEYDNVINYKDLQENPQDYIFRCDFFELKELIDIKPANGVYIKSSTEPFDNQMEINEKKVHKWLKLFNLPLFDKEFHASGHANGQEILNMIRDINPEKVYPVHTVYKDKFKELCDDGIEVIYPILHKN
ncbi:MBL fold metallo-hydrolase [Methanobacterium petrolearium]|uniref:MBL fold metallo-hydrolase n=2 Tax=Methanobacterium petrolearium TaxID=710190 RepID=UPI001AE7973D|nr:MBL fold metallo-hydrolase [Methanobacterium petrolearium]MBP1945316.1 ribonuclease J [Methanobacterium petrolearium]